MNDAEGSSAEEGYIKFACDLVTRDLEPFAELDQLNACRRKLMQLKLIGIYRDGIGFGNISIRDGAGFYITGSATGGKAVLSLSDISRVSRYDFRKNRVQCEGQTAASSESLTHAAVYECSPATKAVIHAHDFQMWKQLLNEAPTTSPEVAYGTPEMAFEVKRLFEETDVQAAKIFVMAGHKEGVVAFGRSLDEAFDILLKNRPAP